MNTERETLAGEVIEALTKPMAYPQIESIVGARENYELGIVLTNLVIEKRLHYRDPANYSKHWPMYSVKPFRKNFKLIERSELSPNPR